MASTASQILEDILDTLRQAGVFERVTLGESASATTVPRTEVLLDGTEEYPADDSAGEQWRRLRIRVKLHTRAASAGDATTRMADLFAAARDALLDDPYRGKLCHDLPIGRATEIGRMELSTGVRRPEIESSFTVRCHFEHQEGQ